MTEYINDRIPWPYDKMDDYEGRYGITEKHERLAEALEEFDRYCRGHGIQYSLGDGTLLGAMRHADFIPWDDDADVMMTRAEYLRLRETLNEKSGIKMFKIGFLDRFSTEKLLKTGEYIDVFINEEMPANRLVFRRKKFMTGFLRTGFRGLAENIRFREYSGGRRLLHRAISGISGAFARLYAGGRNLADLNERAVNLGRHKPSGIYTRYTSSMAETGLRFDKESYDAGYGDILFRGRKLMAIRNAKRFLKEMYGDFEQLPPEEKRIPEHPINMMESAERCIRRYN